MPNSESVLTTIMRIGLFGSDHWTRACQILNHETVDLHPCGHDNSGIANRVATGARVAAAARELGAELLLDVNGDGLSFVPSSHGASAVQLTHDAVGKILCSHLLQPVTKALQHLDWSIACQSLQSPGWVKAVADQAHAVELARFGVPNVIYLPPAAPDGNYDTAPPDPGRCRPIATFVGNHDAPLFTSNAGVPASSLFAGTLAHAVQAGLPALSFYQLYHEVFGLGEAPTPNDDIETRTARTSAYFNAKHYYAAAQNLRCHDRFVLFLKRKFGHALHIVGKGWNSAYGFDAQTPPDDIDGVNQLFRTSAINLASTGGETALNEWHFRITAAGGFMLCQDHPALREHFDVGTECDVFANEEELVAKIQHYVDHPDERAAIAAGGQRRTLAHHLYKHRLQTLLHMLFPPKQPCEFAQSSPWADIGRLVPEPDVVLDCGANIGQTVEGIRPLFPKAEIYSFEPVAELYEKLCATCDRVNAHAVKLAVGDYSGTATINLTSSHQSNSLLGFQEGSPCAQWHREIGQEQIEISTLDQWCRTAGVDPNRVDILKLDVQGSELSALKGACRLLESVKLILLEVSFVQIYKHIPLFDEIDRFMHERGFRRHAIYPSDQPRFWGDALYIKQ